MVKLVLLKAGAVTTVPPNLKGVALPLRLRCRWCCITKLPVLLTLMVSPPGIVAVPRLTVPPVTAMAGSARVSDVWRTSSLLRVTFPPVTTRDGEAPDVVKVQLTMLTRPPDTVQRGIGRIECAVLDHEGHVGGRIRGRHRLSNRCRPPGRG